MNFRRRGRSMVDMLFILTLFAVFMVSALFIVLFGARIYKRIVADSDINYDSRTSIAYISEKLRQHDKEGAVDIIYDGDAPVLRLSETYAGNSYYTYLYERDSSIMEITSPAEYEPIYSAGQQILEVTSFTIRKEGASLYRFDIKDKEGNDIDFFISLQSNPAAEASEND